MKRQIKINSTLGEQSHSEQSNERDEADILQQNLNNEIKRQRLGISYQEPTENESLSAVAVANGTENEENEYHIIDNEQQTSTLTTVEEQTDQSIGSIQEKILTVELLSDHSDIVQQVISDGILLISASLDTTVKVWSAIDGQQICSLRGHTGSVNSAVLLHAEDSQALAEELKCHEIDRFIISGSQDCSLRIWTLPTGTQLKSIYVYNGINCICYLGETKVLLGTDGGKLQIWNILNNNIILSVNAYTDRVSKVEVNGKFIASISADGKFKLWYNVEGQLQEQTQKIKIQNQNLKCQCFHISEETLYFTDFENNLYVLDLKTNEIKKLTNPVKSTEESALCIARNMVFLSWYDHECDLSCIDVYQLPSCEYKYSFIGEVSLIRSICCIQLTDYDLSFATGGKQLIIWRYCKYSQAIERTNEDLKFQVMSRQTDGLLQDNNISNLKSLKEYFCESENSRTWMQQWCTIL